MNDAPFKPVSFGSARGRPVLIKVEETHPIQRFRLRVRGLFTSSSSQKKGLASLASPFFYDHLKDRGSSSAIVF